MEAGSASRLRLDEAMLAWFHPEQNSKQNRREQFTESDLRGISEALRRSGQVSWSRIPRIYTILRSIDQLSTIDVFVSNGITDLSFPFTQKTLPEALKSITARSNFLETQVIVLSKALDLERDRGKHRHFASAADIPFEKIAELGKGAFGYVDKVYSTVSYREYARKLIPRGRTFRKDQVVLRDYERELGTLKRLSHRHVVELIGSYTDPRFVGIIMSPVADCNLKDFLDVTPIPSDSLSFLRTFFGCLAAALRYLHENKVRHKDIKPQNVLVKGHDVYLTDFGISLDWSELDRSTTSGPTTKTLRYCAPEVAADEPRQSSSDIWSLGCVFLEAWTVLCGHKISELNMHMATTGSSSSSYHSNMNAVDSWCEMLQLGQGADAKKPYSWISLALKTDRTSRCSAQTLFETIQEVSIDPSVPFVFAGLCCLEDEDTAESVVSSEVEIEYSETVVPSSSRNNYSKPRTSNRVDSRRLSSPLRGSPGVSHDRNQFVADPSVVRKASGQGPQVLRRKLPVRSSADSIEKRQPIQDDTGQVECVSSTNSLHSSGLTQVEEPTAHCGQDSVDSLKSTEWVEPQCIVPPPPAPATPRNDLPEEPSTTENTVYPLWGIPIPLQDYTINHVLRILSTTSSPVYNSNDLYTLYQTSLPVQIGDSQEDFDNALGSMLVTDIGMRKTWSFRWDYISKKSDKWDQVLVLKNLVAVLDHFGIACVCMEKGLTGIYPADAIPNPIPKLTSAHRPRFGGTSKIHLSDQREKTLDVWHRISFGSSATWTIITFRVLLFKEKNLGPYIIAFEHVSGDRAAYKYLAKAIQYTVEA